MTLPIYPATTPNTMDSLWNTETDECLETIQTGIARGAFVFDDGNFFISDPIYLAGYNEFMLSLEPDQAPPWGPWLAYIQPRHPQTLQPIPDIGGPLNNTLMIPVVTGGGDFTDTNPFASFGDGTNQGLPADTGTAHVFFSIVLADDGGGGTTGTFTLTCLAPAIGAS